MIKEQTKSNYIFRWLVLVVLLCGFVIAGKAQKKLRIHVTGSDRSLNINSANIYFVIAKDTIFIPKMEKLQFEFPSKFDSLLAGNSDSLLTMLVETTKYIYVTKVNAKIVRETQHMYLKYYMFKGHLYASFGFELGEVLSRAIPSKRIRKRKYKYIQPTYYGR